MPRPSNFKVYDIIAIDQHDFDVRSNGSNSAREAPDLRWRVGIVYHSDESSYPRLSGVFLDEQGRPTSEGFNFHPNGQNVQRVEFTKMNIQVDIPENWRKGLVQPAPKAEPLSARQGEDLPELHPSYGVVTVGRTSGSTKLFMSPFNHQRYMSLTVSRASRRRSLSDDCTFGEGELIRVSMSESQWARMVSSVGDGSGVPCTLSRVGTSMMPECPENDEKAVFQIEVEKAAKEAAKKLIEARRMVQEIMSKPTINKADRREIMDILASAETALNSNLPFVVQQFTERMGVITDEAKTEIQAFVDNTFKRAGLQALQAAGVVQFQLPESKEE